MSRKTRPARRAAFLKALRETGNQALAAERAKVSRRWVCLHRKDDPDFRRTCDAAIGEARASFDRLRADGATGPPSGWGSSAGEELVVRGSNSRRLQVARARLHQWTPRIEDRFLAALAASCNVRAACAAVGMSAPSAYKHRKRWPGFARRWEAAMLAGYERLDRGLVAAAIAFLDPHIAEDIGVARPGDPAVAPVSFDDAIRLVRLHEKRALEAARRRMGWPEAGPKAPGRR